MLGRAKCALPTTAATAAFATRAPLQGSQYADFLRYMYSINLFQTVKMGLDNIARLDDKLGRPSEKFPVVHVAGTNGKGSVTWKLGEALRMDGRKCGIFTSPHLSSFRERIRVNGELISEDELVDALVPVKEVLDGQPATFFEVTTLLALLHFARQEVDVVVLETGLGGRLDATNIVDPVLSVITSVDLDHMKILGNTVEAIAREKAGIIKPGRPAVVGTSAPVDLLQEYAQSVGAPCFVAPTEGLGIDFDAYNTTLAATCLDQLPPQLAVRNLDAAREGLATRPPCRFEVLPVGWGDAVLWLPRRCPTLVMDVAHNPAGVESFLAKLRTTYPTAMASGRVTAVVGCSADKVEGGIIASIARHLPPESVHVVQSLNHRAADASLVAASLSDMWHGAKPASVWPAAGAADASSAVFQGVSHAAHSAVAAGHELMVVFGSLYMMADARRAVGIVEPVDPVSF